MSTIERLNYLLTFLEDRKNYFSGFSHVMKNSVLALELKSQLWDAGEIGDNESLAISNRIEKARCNAIETHKAFVIKTLRNNPNHTVESIVNSIYNEIF